MRAILAALLVMSGAAVHADPLPFSVILLVESQGSTIAAFKQCSQIGNNNDVILLRNGGGGEIKTVGRLHIGDIVCTRGLSPDLTLWNWRQDAVAQRTTYAKNGKLQLLDTGFNVAVSWTLSHAWLSQIVYDLTSETIVITSDRVNRDGLPVDPSITWSPQPLTYGEVLGDGQLNATTTAPGTFTYDPPAGTLLDAGVHTLHATFTPADPTQFSTAHPTAQLTVLKATPALFDLASPVIAKGTATTPLSGRIAAGTLIPPAGESVSIKLINTVQPGPIQTNGTFASVFATGALAVSATPYPIAYSYAGDGNFNAVAGAGTLTVAYLGSFSGGTTTTPGINNENPNRPFVVKITFNVNGSIPGDFTAFVNYAPAARGANVTSIVSDGTWKLHADNRKPLPKGIVSGTITGGTIQWNAAGNVAAVALRMRIDNGNGDFARINGTAELRNGVWDFTVSPPALQGQLLLFY